MAKWKRRGLQNLYARVRFPHWPPKLICQLHRSLLNSKAMMKRLSLVVLASVIFAGCTLPAFPTAKKAGLQVSSTPAATVFVGGNSLGSTPLQNQENLKPGQVTVKIVPQDATLVPYETQINLIGGVMTVIDRKFNANPDMSNGYSLSFEPITDKKANQIAITTLPSAVAVNVDGNPQDFTPTMLDSVPEGDHRITLTSPGYEDKVILARTISGYKLVINAQLAKKADLAPVVEVTPTPSVTLTPTPSLKPTLSPAKTSTPSAAVNIPKPYAQVGDTPTGFLRVRSTPNGTEIGQVKPGEAYPYLSTNADSTWVQIQFNPTTPGWVSAQYVTVVK